MFKGECALDEHSLARIKNEDRVFEMIDEMAAIDAQIKSIDAKMDEALGKDKNTWTLLNAKRQALSGRMTVINKNYRTLLESQKALTLASEVRRAKEDAKEAMRQIGEREVIEFEERNLERAKSYI